jgi:hypothetical protein
MTRKASSLRSNEVADLEIGLSRRDATNYSVEMRFTQPGSDAETRLPPGSLALAHFDLPKLQDYLLQPDEYGRLLSAGLFADSSVQTMFGQSVSVAQSLDSVLRMRLAIGSSAPELHGLRWETLRHPQTDELLLTHEQVFFSRYMSSMDWRPVRLRPRSELRALVIVANPSNLSSYKPGGYELAPIDVEGEVARAREHMGTIPVTELSSLANGPVTLNAISAALREGYDIVYLVAHGALIDGESFIWLENEEGTAGVVKGNELVTRIREQTQRPRLAVLASCQSASYQEPDEYIEMQKNDSMVALGPHLAEAGIPSVLAMQGNISMKTVKAFMPLLFEEMQKDGQIDRAVAVARGTVRDSHDWWMPVLFMRLKSGRIWYVPGFGDGGKDFEKWPALMRNINRGKCTPIIGPHLTQKVSESPQEIARELAEKYNFPLAIHQRYDLPQVAQYLSVNQDPEFPRDELLRHLHEKLQEQIGDDSSPRVKRASLETLFAMVGKKQRANEPHNPYKVLAELPLPIYVTTNLSNLLSEALKAAGKDPQVEICRWNEYLEDLPSIYDDEPDYRPDPDRPLVYHLFGTSEEPDSLVITEDDYFDFLIGVSRNKEIIPSVVNRALADTALLFLGFRMDDWSFRILFRSIMSQEGGSRRKRYAHVAAQIDPEEERFHEPERARRYLETYFEDSDINTFWGTVEDFTRELTQRLKE